MPRSPSPPRAPRRRSPSPRRDAGRDDRYRERSRSPPRGPSKRPKELSFYKKSAMGSFSQRRDPLDTMEESARDRMERRERGEVPQRFGGTREQGVRNTMSLSASHSNQPSGVGSFRRSNDPLDRMPTRGDREGERDSRRDEGPARDRRDRQDGDRDQEKRLAAMAKPGAPSAAPLAGTRMIEIIANDRLGRKVRIKCLPTDTVGDLKRLIAAQTGTTAQKIQLKKWYTVFKDSISLQDYEINDGMSLEMY